MMLAEKAPPAIEFEEDGHVYRVGGVVVPSVTQALSVIERGFGGVDPEVLERAQRFGSHVHKAIELDNLGTLDEESLDPAIAPYLAQWRRFVAETGFHVEHGEALVYHPRARYAGRADVVGILRGTRWLIDLKSGAVPRTAGPQTAAYAEAYRWTTGKRVTRRAALKLTAASYSAVPYSDPADLSNFLSSLNCYRFIHHGRI